MREILFRGKRIDNGEWVEGFYYKAKYYKTDTELLDYITIPHPDEMYRGSDHILVDPKTVGQFTWLYDKYGKRIFEGDIIYMGLFPYVVKYDTENARYMLYTSGDSKRDGFNAFTMETHEVIGNVHDNPGLTEE
jgi:uncharacterized phage protein (TIGR01671 family)